MPGQRVGRPVVGQFECRLPTQSSGSRALDLNRRIRP